MMTYVEYHKERDRMAQRQRNFEIHLKFLASK
jgi:hypothetical protein